MLFNVYKGKVIFNNKKGRCVTVAVRDLSLTG